MGFLKVEIFLESILGGKKCIGVWDIIFFFLIKIIKFGVEIIILGDFVLIFVYV